MKKTKLFVLSAAALVTIGALAGCNNGGAAKGAVAKIIEEAQKMDEAELYKKAMEEINGKKFTVVANSSRMKDAAPAWMEYVKGTEGKGGENFEYKDANFAFTFATTQPKNNQIFAQIKADVTGANHNIAMTLIQDGSQIKNKMTKTGYLLNYIPKGWEEQGGNKLKDGEPLALQSLSKVFCYNKGSDTPEYKNVWNFAIDLNTQFMTPASEPVGQNFLYMLTKPAYATYVKDAYDALDAKCKEYVDDLIAGKEYKFENGDFVLSGGAKQSNGETGIAELMADGGFEDDVKYSLAWTYAFLKHYTAVSDDGPISQNITQKSAKGSAGLLVYSKFRSIQESEDVSVKPIEVAAYQDGYVGFGGYMYKHYLQILSTSPYPWTSCALIHFMTMHQEGFQPWGKDAGGYSSNPTVQACEAFDHSRDGNKKDENGNKTDEVEFKVKNDKGYTWWTGTANNQGRLVLEDGEYCTKVAATMAEWIQYLR